MRAGTARWVAGLVLCTSCTSLNAAYDEQRGEEEVGTRTTSTDDPASSGRTSSGGATGTGKDAGSSATVGGPTDDSTTTVDELSTTGHTNASSSGGGPVDSEPAQVVFINFDGVTLTSGFNDATANVIQSYSGTFAPYTPVGDIPSIMTGLNNAWAGINVEFAATRPADGDYTMVVVTPTNPVGPGIAGLGPADCDDTNPSDVALVFTDEVNSPDSIVGYASRYLGLSFGLDVVASETDFMKESAGPGSEFDDVCNALTETPICGDHRLCAAEEQNSFAELVARFDPG